MQDNEKLLASPASQLARISRERLIRLVQRGEITGELVAGRYLIDRGALEDWIRRRDRDAVLA